jgi:hypothetical protein
MDAISWRRLTSIVKSDLLSPKKRENRTCGGDFTDERSLLDNSPGKQRVTIMKTGAERGLPGGLTADYRADWWKDQASAGAVGGRVVVAVQHQLVPAAGRDVEDDRDPPRASR